MNMKFLGTRYPDRHTMQALGICKEVGKLFHEDDVVSFTSMKFNGFQEESCQFLGTLALHLYSKEEKKSNNRELGFISFNIRGKRFTPPSEFDR